MKGQKVLELFALCAPTSPHPHDTSPAALLPQCMLIPHETLLILVQISCVFPTDTASDVQEADTTHYREVNTSAARADYLASPASCLPSPDHRSPQVRAQCGDGLQTGRCGRGSRQGQKRLQKQPR